MEAAQDGNVDTLKYLIEDKKIDVNTQGPGSYPWVS